PSSSRSTASHPNNDRMTPARFRELIRRHELAMVDLKFIDLPGTWQHFSIPAEGFTDELFSEGIGFDGSSIRGFQHIHESDMLLVADASTAIVDPACTVPTLSLICNVLDPLSREPTRAIHAMSARKRRPSCSPPASLTPAISGPS